MQDLVELSTNLSIMICAKLLHLDLIITMRLSATKKDCFCSPFLCFLQIVGILNRFAAVFRHTCIAALRIGVRHRAFAALHCSSCFFTHKNHPFESVCAFCGFYPTKKQKPPNCGGFCLILLTNFASTQKAGKMSLAFC